MERIKVVKVLTTYSHLILLTFHIETVYISSYEFNNIKTQLIFYICEKWYFLIMFLYFCTFFLVEIIR